MLKVAQFITSEEIPILNIYNLCKHRTSKEIQHYMITDSKYDFIDFFRHEGIPCIVINSKKAYKNLLKKIDVIHFHWISYNRKEHDLVKSFKLPFAVTLYSPEKLPPSIPFVICPFNFIREIQGRPESSAVIYDGIDVKRFSKISNDAFGKAKNTETTNKSILIASDITTQYNDYFWILMQEFLSRNSEVELQIIGPGWHSLTLVKAINNKIKVYPSIALSDAFIYTPITSNDLKIESSLHFVFIAMAMGVPCIVLKNKFTEEIIQHRINGIMVRQDRLFCCLSDINDILRDYSLRKRCIKNAYQTVCDKFDVKLNVGKYETILEAVAKNKKWCV